ncbi:MAG TPA: NlpC/P60 family protein [Actinomycetota bacterium]|nr:NlpC/P60 family protein [Actinomycetota bacterium]
MPPLRTHPLRARLGTALVASMIVAGAIAAAGLPATAAPSASELEAAKERMMELERDFELVVEDYNRVHEELTGLQQSIAVAELEVTKLERRMGGREDDAIALARELYIDGGATAIEAVLSSEDIADIESRLEYLHSSQEAQAKVFEDLAVDRDALDQQLVVLERDRAAAAAAEQRLLALREDVEATLAAQKDEVDELSAAIARAERLRSAREAAAAEAAAAAQVASVGVPAGVPTVKASSPGAQIAVDAALSQSGKPYEWGAEGPDTYDCSGLMLWAWAHAGVSLPHNSGMQYNATPRVAQSDWQPGDLLFFGSPIHHVAMYIGSGQMVEAPYSGQQVRVVSAYRSDYVGAGRPGV